jgi:hypothetical protein
MIYFKFRAGFINAYILVLTIAAVLAFSSCKKESVKYPYNDIERFTIKDANGAELKASIENGNIILYYPPFQTVPDFITPAIVVSEKSVVEPASGARVAFKDGVTFKVKAQDGSTKTYVLKRYINAPAPQFEANTDAKIGDYIQLTGEFMIPDTNRTKLYLVDKNNKEIKVQGSAFENFTASGLNALLPATLDTGIYKIKLLTDGQPLIKNNFHIAPPFLKILISPNMTTVKRGAELILVSSDNSLKYYKNNIDRMTVYVDLRNSKDVTITSVTDSEIRLRIPADFPLINIQYAGLYFKNNPEVLYISQEGNGVQVTE